ncbi:hypothetical protein O3M35_006475 [Rhynocoris fuscipes]|uniref:Odorant receptor n=1 Tax=Rhynocoris fuscipes TaxID=488301 RepID=A0AAW1DF23_9HEMI
MISTDMNMLCRLMINLGMWYPRSTEIRSRLLLYMTEIRHIIGFSLWFLILYSVFLEGFRKSMEGTAFYVVIGTLCNLFIVVFYFKRKDTYVLVNLLDKILSNRKYNWEIEFVQIRAKFIWKCINYFNNFFIIYTNIVFCIIPILNWILKYYEFSSISYIPLPLRALSVMKSSRHYLPYIWDFLGCLWSYLAISLYLGPLDSFVMLTSYTGIEIELLCEKIRLLSLNDDDEHYSINCLKNDITLKDIIEHHQTILRLINYYVKFFQNYNVKTLDQFDPIYFLITCSMILARSIVFNLKKVFLSYTFGYFKINCFKKKCIIRVIIISKNKFHKIFFWPRRYFS